MKTHSPSDPDLVAVVESLDEDAIRAELDRLDRRSDALKVLLRAARARRRREEASDAR
jgi:hypothetical protein